MAEKVWSETSVEMRRLGSLCDKETSSVDKFTPVAVIHKLQEQELHRTITRSQTYINPYGYALPGILVHDGFFNPWEISTKGSLERHETLKVVLQTSLSKLFEIENTEVQRLLDQHQTVKADAKETDDLPSSLESLSSLKSTENDPSWVCFRQILSFLEKAPLIRLKEQMSEELYGQYFPKSIPRRKLAGLFYRYSREDYEAVKDNIKFIQQYLAEDVGVFVCASSEGPNPVGTGEVRISQAKDFCWRNLREKWDFENWCPLPNGQKNPPIRRLTDRDDLPVQEEISTAEKGK
ncbi:hypothetical protein PIIN_10800 [Serendipita indica DSM 11827]|uniref:Uncharacterized protein n=1 Tax=Serendipita indica (strain DSM 11827) TaxID=1109443 RepID=G4TZS1_SERID|nr:hypothetical protein PIIN_10800 [Serendipita indica DSM 11827]